MWKPIEEFDNSLVDGYVLFMKRDGNFIFEKFPSRVKYLGVDYIATYQGPISFERLVCFCLVSDIMEC